MCALLEADRGGGSSVMTIGAGDAEAGAGFGGFSNGCTDEERVLGKGLLSPAASEEYDLDTTICTLPPRSPFATGSTRTLQRSRSAATSTSRASVSRASDTPSATIGNSPRRTHDWLFQYSMSSTPGVGQYDVPFASGSWSKVRRSPSALMSTPRGSGFPRGDYLVHDSPPSAESAAPGPTDYDGQQPEKHRRSALFGSVGRFAPIAMADAPWLARSPREEGRGSPGRGDSSPRLVRLASQHTFSSDPCRRDPPSPGPGHYATSASGRHSSPAAAQWRDRGRASPGLRQGPGAGPVAASPRRSSPVASPSTPPTRLTARSQPRKMAQVSEYQYWSPCGWTTYDAEACRLLREADARGDLVVRVYSAKAEYEVDLRALTQTNIRTRNTRRIRRPAAMLHSGIAGGSATTAAALVGAGDASAGAGAYTCSLNGAGVVGVGMTREAP
eukprot:TRINITY_DN17547_c0_g1_i1.p1 TRINITY_DN17547_c0_g1~~TRINITY_DN17547_c0_g1_i1.p1  ORF type:complete len:444 (-),score=58.37 TRINITY_DN17547_c0_g1_i1:106-1437(-)